MAIKKTRKTKAKAKPRVKAKPKAKPKAKVKAKPAIKLESNSKDEIAESKLRMDILEHVPDKILKELYALIGCQCTIDAYDHFQQASFDVTRQMQFGINDLYYDLFKERVRTTQCAPCMFRRINRIREEFTKIIG